MAKRSRSILHGSSQRRITSPCGHVRRSGGGGGVKLRSTERWRWSGVALDPTTTTPWGGAIVPAVISDAAAAAR
ncbi:unnamed protein product [Lampetra fluviatilis]